MHRNDVLIRAFYALLHTNSFVLGRNSEITRVKLAVLAVILNLDPAPLVLITTQRRVLRNRALH